MTDPRAKSIPRTIAHYATSRLYQQALGVITAFLRPKLLTPEQFGLWTLLKIIPRYSYYTDLGTGASFRYLVPYYKEKGDCARVEAIERCAFSAGFGLSVLLAVVILAFYLREGFGPEVKAGLLCMAGMVVLQFVHEYYLILLKAHERFSLVASTNYVFITAAFLLTVPLLYFLRIYGLFLSVLLAELVALAYLRIRLGSAVRWGLKKDVFRELVGKGLPLTLLNLAVVLIMTADRIVVSSMLGNEQLGYYGVAGLAMSALINVPEAAREVIEPRAMRAVDSVPTEALISEYLWKPAINTAYLMPFLIGPAFLALPPFISLFLPKHVDAIAPGQILLCGVYFLSLAYVPRVVIVARNWQTQTLVLMPWAIAANVGLSVWSIRADYGLPGVAAASGFSYFLLFGLLLAFLGRKLERSGWEWWRYLGETILPFLIMCALLVGWQVLLPRYIANPYGRAALGCLAFLALFSGFHAAARRRLPLLKKMIF
ncbi:MAG TPA: oligosaccharide flippase family protein [Sumerlaeia bacterium]|nr:oligosaccharide flippase family protein [Sumerlaeia bacterium]